MNQSQLFEIFNKDSSNFSYDESSKDHQVEQIINQDNDCSEVSASKCCNGEVLILNQKVNLSKLETLNDQENKIISQPKEFSNFQQPQINELEFNKNEKPCEDNNYNYSSSYDNEFENKTCINSEDILMDIENVFKFKNSSLNMNSNNVDLNSSNINNKAIEEDKKNQRKDEKDLLRQSTVRKTKDLLNDNIVQPLIRKILGHEIKSYIWKPIISNEIIYIQEELAKYCRKSIKTIYLEAKPCNHSPEGIEKNQKKINELYEKSKNNEDNIYCKTFKNLMDLPFIEMLKIYKNKDITKVLKIYSDNSKLPKNLKEILDSFGNLGKDFKNKDKEKIYNKREKSLEDFIALAENIRKQEQRAFNMFIIQ